MAKARVLYLIETLDVGGAEKSLLELLPRLCTFAPVVCQIYKGSALRAAYVAAGIPVISLNVPPKYHFPTAVRLVDRVIEDVGPSVIHTTLFRADQIGRFLGARHKIPVVGSFVSECYAPIRWEGLSPTERFKLFGVRAIDRVTSRWAAHFVANSYAVMRSETKQLGVPSSKVTVIYRGRDATSVRTSGTRNREALRASLGITPDAPVVLNVARLVESKGQEALIHAFRGVVEDNGAAHLLIAGDGPHRAALNAAIRAWRLESNVHLLGNRDDVEDLLRAADVFAFPSHYEGHPGAVVEAMMAGLPVVLSDIPVHAEIVEDGRAGLLVPLRDTDAWARILRELLSDGERRSSLGAHAHACAIVKFRIESMAAAYESLYAEVTSPGCRQAQRVS